MTTTTLKMAISAMADQQSVAADVAKRPGITTTTLYAYVTGDGSLKEAGEAVLWGRSVALTDGAATERRVPPYTYCSTSFFFRPINDRNDSLKLMGSA